jgi:hypothetical protein
MRPERRFTAQGFHATFLEAVAGEGFHATFLEAVAGEAGYTRGAVRVQGGPVLRRV